MSRHCTVCTHAEREAIDEAIVGRRGSIHAIARRYQLHKDALLRHRDTHISPALVAAAADRDAGAARTLLDRVESLIGRTERLLGTAEQSGSVVQALAAVREMRGLLELMGKASGELKPDGAVTVVNIQASPEWHAIRAAVFEALFAFPEAREAVAGRLLAVNGSTAPHDALVASRRPTTHVSSPVAGGVR